ncbi:MAG: ATP-dependent helicase HrpB [Planctomycetota bacterium]|nr:MAG: ATP-dependent helicase HrpB [Planctomycetota bacterium]
MSSMRDELPIDAHLPEIARALRERGALVLVAEPGAGKTTRVPPALVDAGLAGGGQVVVLQPRRLAARAAAARISAERGDSPGGFCGWQIRFEKQASARTRVLVVTEGILTRRLQDDPTLDGVGIVVLDEFHERSLHADLALALLAAVRRELRPDLKLVVMSATLEAEPVAAFLDAPIVRVPGRSHPLEIEYADPPREAGAVERALLGLRAALARREGDVLCFLPGAGEIERVANELARGGSCADAARDCDVRALHGDLALDDQERALRPGPRRRVILCTNIAETSLTVPGVRIVVDTGLARVLAHDPDSGLDRLELARISKASAAQRAGRAARTASGVAIRAWSRAEQTLMRAHDVPEIRRVDLARPALELHAFGERDLSRFGWFEAPEPAALERAEQLLVGMGAIERESRALTPIGAALAALPLHPRLARVLVGAHEAGMTADGALLAALLSERDLVRRSERVGARGGAWLATGPSDLLARRDLFVAEERGRSSGLVDRGAARRVADTAAQLERLAARSLGRAGATPATSEAREDALLRAIWLGYADRVARRLAPGRPEAAVMGGRQVALGPDSVVTEEPLFAVLDADAGGWSGAARARVRSASVVRRAWLERSALGIATERAVEWDAARDQVVGIVRTLHGDLVLDEGRTGSVDAALAARMLVDQAAKAPERALALTDSAAALRERLACLAEWMPELALPGVADADLLAALDGWIDRATSFADLRALPWSDVLMSRLSREQQLALERHAPESLALPSGSTRRLEYARGKPPVLAVRLQELFGQPDTPRVANGKIAVLLHLLSPNQRVVQVTADLSSFWNNTYPQVRKDLRGRYPKHSWPDDPWTAEPTARAKRRPRG